MHRRIRAFFLILLLAGLLMPNVGCDGLEEFADALDNVADALDDVADDLDGHDRWYDEVLDDIEDWFD